MLKLLLICVICATVDAKRYTEDYFWRDYGGITPSDALQGGLDKNRKPIYIGQVLYYNKLIPGQIYENGSKIHYEYKGATYATDQNVKILCTDQPKKFEWICTKSNEVHKLTNRILIKGGFEPNIRAYIGRVFADGERCIGKVICRPNNCLGLYTANDGKYRHTTEFEILTLIP